MPTSLHPQAKFDPIPPDLDLDALVDSTPSFEWVVRVSAAQIRNLGPLEFEKLVTIHVINGGRPLVIEKWNGRLPRELFSADWLETGYDKKQENVWDITAQTNMPMTTGHYLRSMKQLADQWTPSTFRDDRRQRLYLKDIDCPPEWHDHLRKVLPPSLFYFNDNVDDKGSREDDMFVEERTAAPAGDLMSSLPEPMRAQNLMCYIGHEGTYTPAHREMCASLGQNIMVEASGNDNGEKEGSSIWFMTETKDREVVREYFLSMLGHDIEIEKHFAQINAWKKATFPVYVVEQKVGDFILVPPLAPHQVWNRGTRTMKVAWNRTTVETLQMAMHEALPKARLVCRDEQYKNKAIVYFTLQKYYGQLQSMEESTALGWLGIGQDLLRDSARMRQMAGDFRRLLDLFTEILVDEMFSSKEKDVEFLPFDSNITCSYCRANIFNRFLTCKHCIRELTTGDEDTYDICMECYAMGRSCVCISGLHWCEQWDWAELVNNYENWRTMAIQNDGFVDVDLSPLPLEIARRKSGHKAVAQICQEQLRRRPFKDITKPDEQGGLPEELPEPEVDAEGRIKKKRAKKKKKGETYRCHTCSHQEFVYKLAFCTTPGCSEAYCFGVLYRGFDLMPQAVLQQEKWKCPKCLEICNCGYCRKMGITNPYIPKNTLLGHDTRKVADDRSVESLVDFRLHNLGWLKNVGEATRTQHSTRMQRLRQAANAAKAAEAGDSGGLDVAMPQPPPMIEDDDGEPTSQGHAAEGAEGAAASAAAALHHVAEQLGGSAADVADMSLSREMDVDESSYPDPDSYGAVNEALDRERMLGLGYYQQDDTPDKILFDIYQQPSADALEPDDDELPEFLKKTMRAAKRKAKLHNDDDPDFSAPRRWANRKKARMDNEASLPNIAVDPALLGEGSPLQGDEDAQREVDDDADLSDPDASQGLFRYEANKPEPRHVKPLVSYQEGEDETEFDEVLPVKEGGNPWTGAVPDENGSVDPLDLAADAVRLLTGGKGRTQAATSSEGAPAPKRGRGRPRLRGTASRSSLRRTAQPATPLSEPKEKPRSSRTSMLARQGRDRAATDDANDAEDDEDGDNNEDVLDELEAQLEANLATEAAAKHPEPSEAEPPKKRRGRPPKSRGGAVVNAVGRTRGSAGPTASSPIDTRFLTMAERMALNGRKFKVGTRKSGGPRKTESAQVTSVASVVIRQQNPSAQAPVSGEGTPEAASVGLQLDGHDDEWSSSAAREAPASPLAAASSPRPAGPTVVRLGSVSDASHYSMDDTDDSSVSDDDDDDDGDDEDIPASKAAPVARRGGPVGLRISGRGGRAIRGGRRF